MNHFAYPDMFLLLALPFIVRALLPAVKGLHGEALRIPFLKDIEKISIKSGGLWSFSSFEGTKISKPLIFLYLIWALLVISIARPQWLGEPMRLQNYSRDIVLVTDISNSMLEKDFVLKNRRINRLTAVKNAATEFIKKRLDDRIGLILFATRAYNQAPLTYDKQSVVNILWQTDAGMAGDSTAIGDALGLALKSLKDAKNPENKIIILLTDGENNDGSLSMPQVLDLAKNEGIKIYTIGVGSPNSLLASFFGAKIPDSPFEDKELKQLAEMTKGSYFKANDTKGLQKIYDTIDKLEPNLNEDKFIQETVDLYYIPLLLAIILSAGLFLAVRRGR